MKEEREREREKIIEVLPAFIRFHVKHVLLLLVGLLKAEIHD